MAKKPIIDGSEEWCRAQLVSLFHELTDLRNPEKSYQKVDTGRVRACESAVSVVKVLNDMNNKSKAELILDEMKEYKAYIDRGLELMGMRDFVKPAGDAADPGSGPSTDTH